MKVCVARQMDIHGRAQQQNAAFVFLPPKDLEISNIPGNLYAGVFLELDPGSATRNQKAAQESYSSKLTVADINPA